MALKYLIEKEFKQIVRNPIIPKMILAYPLIIMILLPWAVDLDVKNVRMVVVDNSNTIYSHRIVSKINASKYFTVVDQPSSYNMALGSIESDKADMILEIPANFETDFVKEKKASVMVSANGVNSLKGQLGSNYIFQLIDEYNQELLAEFSSIPQTQKKRIEVVSDFRYNPKLDYKIYMIPAFIALLITLICGILPALNVVSEKEVGTIQQINVSPVTKYEFILAKLIPYWIIGVIILTIAILMSWLMYGVVPTGGILTTYATSIIFIMGISGMGIIISNYSETLQQATFLVFFFILIIILISGLFTPVESMPFWARIIAYLNPLTYYVDLLRRIFLYGCSFGEVLGLIYSIVIFAVSISSFAILSYNKRVK